MSLLSRLFNRTEDDLTKGWPPAQGPIPRVSLERRALETFGGRLTFGEPIAGASVLGRPSRVQTGKGLATLEYEPWALTLEFENDRFVQATFAIGENRAGPSGELTGPDGLTLNGRTTKGDLLQRFGEPTKTQELDEETIVYYTTDGMTSEFLLDEDGHLVEWDVYLD